MNQRIVLLGQGNTIAVVAGTEQTGGAFSLLDYELAPGFVSLPPHTHQREDMGIYVLEGRLLVRIGLSERLIGQGEFIFLPRGVMHAQSNPGPDPVRFLTFLLPAGFERCFLELEALLEVDTPSAASAIAPLLAGHGVHMEQAGPVFTRQERT